MQIKKSIVIVKIKEYVLKSFLKNKIMHGWIEDLFSFR